MTTQIEKKRDKIIKDLMKYEYDINVDIKLNTINFRHPRLNTKFNSGTREQWDQEIIKRIIEISQKHDVYYSYYSDPIIFIGTFDLNIENDIKLG